MSSTLKLPKPAAKRFARTEALDALGEASFAAFPARRVPGQVLWCNFELARELGFNVPRTNKLTPTLHDELIAKLSLRAVTPADDVPASEVITMYADRYGGDGVSPALGSGRAGFLPEANLYIKGLGFTPLFRHNDKDDFVHSLRKQMTRTELCACSHSQSDMALPTGRFSDKLSLVNYRHDAACAEFE